jgi:glucokinase
MSYWLGFDLGGTKMQATVFDDGMKILATERKKTKAREGVDAVVDRIVKTMHEALGQAGITPRQLGGIGIGAPGALDLQKGVIKSAPNLGWSDVALQSILEQKMGCRSVVVNDVDAGVYGEYALGAAKGGRCVVGVFPGTGIGGGMVYKGELYTGERSSCMEIGHLIVVPGGALCGCGKYGCLETVASRLAISAEAAVAAMRGQAPNLLQAAGTDLGNIRSAVLAESIAAGDKEVEAIVRRAAQCLGRAIAMCVNLLAPDIIVLGGGLVEAMPNLYGTVVGHEIAANIMDAYRRSYKLVVATLGDDAAAAGAAAWARYLAGTTESAPQAKEN